MKEDTIPSLLREIAIIFRYVNDSGTNAMSDRQVAAMLAADDAYAGSETFLSS